MYYGIMLTNKLSKSTTGIESPEVIDASEFIVDAIGII